jgi:hydrophobe/amphiphile efflux-1 (HAE1) family protein
MALVNQEGWPHKGEIDFVDNQINPETGTIRARGIFPNKDRLMSPGFFAKVRIPGSGEYDGLLIRDAAVGDDQGSSYVWVIDAEDKAVYRPVKLGPLVDGLRVVREGLKADERVVILGLMSVRNGNQGEARAHRHGPHPTREGQAAMNFARIFVDRPIFAGVLSIVITLLGALSYFSLPVAQYPEVIPPTVVVSATYPGADARTLAETVSTPLEQEINGVEDMIYLSSSSTSDGRVQITVTFRLGTDLDKAQVLVQNRVNAAVARLPEEVRRLGVIVNKRSPDLTLAAQFYSPDGSREVGYLSNYVTLQIQNEIARIPGVAEASSLGGLDYSMRVWLDPEKVAGVGLTAGDVVRAIREQNVQVAAGSLGQPPAAEGLEFQYTLTAPGRLKKAEEFGDIVLKTGTGRCGAPARCRPHRTRLPRLLQQDLHGRLQRRLAPRVPASRQQRHQTADAVYARLAQLKERFPPGIDYRINYDTTKFVRASIKSVLTTLIEAVLLVVFVVILFLQSWRASIIPLLAVPVSLIGTLAVMQVFGFSLNNLSLFGLVLAIGIVVDDAIVVVENVERNIAKGLAPREAAIQAMKEVSGAVIAVALVLCAVFVPTAFVSGITGQFYKQFALTIAVSTVISAFNSLTLSPALCAILLQPHGAKTDWLTKLINFLFGWFFRLFNKVFHFGSSLYAGLVRKLIRLALLVLIGYGGLSSSRKKSSTPSPAATSPRRTWATPSCSCSSRMPPPSSAPTPSCARWTSWRSRSPASPTPSPSPVIPPFCRRTSPTSARPSSSSMTSTNAPRPR